MAKLKNFKECIGRDTRIANAGLAWMLASGLQAIAGSLSMTTTSNPSRIWKISIKRHACHCWLQGRQSIIFAIDDVLLPSVVTTPLSVALSSGNGSSNVYSPAINNKQNVISDLQSKTQDEALAPVYLAPQTPPLGKVLIQCRNWSERSQFHT